MDKTNELIDKLANGVRELPEVQEFLHLKELMKTNEELSNMRSEIARLTSENKDEEKSNLLDIYNSHPLVNNYNIIREEVINILRTIKDILSE